MVLFCWILTFYNSWMINITYYFALTMVVLCSQRVAQISAIICPNNSKLAMTIAILIITTLIVLGNNLVPIKKFHYFLQALSDLSFIKYSFELIILSIYGFNRCSQSDISLVLYEFGIESQVFWSNVISLLIIFIVLKLITIFSLGLKINHFLKDRKQQQTDDKDCKTRGDYLIF